MSDPHDQPDDPFLRVKKELEAMEIPDENESLESRLRRKIDAADLDLTGDDEIEAKAREFEANLSRAAGTEVPDIPDFEARLKRLEGKAHESRRRREAEADATARENASNAQSAKGLGIGLTVAYMIIGFPLFGAGVGWLLDRATNSNAFVAFGTVGGAALGVVAAILIINRHSGSL